jgi:Tfp pilus assembly protein PilV
VADRPCLRRHAAGGNLIEVVIALALVAGACLSGAGLLTVGNRQVDRGGQRSQALAVAQAVAEDLRAEPAERLASRLGCDGTAPACTAVTGEAAVAAWQAWADARLPAARLRVDAAALGAGSLDAAPAVRLTVDVGWGHTLRPRAVALSLVHP